MAAAAAAAAVEEEATRFFCHSCTREVHPKLPEYTCPRCDSGFIEELPDQQPSASDGSSTNRNQDPAAQFSERPGSSSSSLPVAESLRGDPERDRERERDRDRDRESQARDRRYRLPRTRHSFRRHRVERSPAIEGIIQQMLGGLWGPARSPFPPFTLDVLHSSPADYVWGAGGLDAIITQLLGQLDNTGPPPADKEKISSLPRITIAQEHLNCSMECAVCKEDYSVGESVRQLPCLHLFHSNCIVPWLEMHDSCPVCRKGLTSELDSTDSSQMELM
ncbi:E3 ubiquitin-protein ligase RNF115-like isoform X2 [Lethenteron reissneri]|uniref:E3 ubiquitin-protein ligase RNF115-like isoform X2 n=1 Tax=Lethenteron reissneri TaxID=7753 RepID=UPI002AB7F0AD|nr:E3 ubiquitin-protein ligase RNF115-like isoform X2 [Lethenteron reissneri]